MSENVIDISLVAHPTLGGTMPIFGHVKNTPMELSSHSESKHLTLLLNYPVLIEPMLSPFSLILFMRLLNKEQESHLFSFFYFLR